jgi:hypothetical protein
VPTSRRQITRPHSRIRDADSLEVPRRRRRQAPVEQPPAPSQRLIHLTVAVRPDGRDETGGELARRVADRLNGSAYAMYGRLYQVEVLDFREEWTGDPADVPDQ